MSDGQRRKMTLASYQVEGDEVTYLAFLQSYPSLRNLELSRLHLHDTASISNLTTLEALSLLEFDQLEDISALSSLGNLRVLNLRGCRSLKDLRPLIRLP